MFFSPFTSFENMGTSVDYLGFLRPGAVVADQIFPQFTVLSRHPAYHGFFCFAFRRARERTGAAKMKNAFARDFRLMEAFWGLAHVAQNAGEGILNVLRYKGARSLGVTAYDDSRLHRIIFQKMHYGVLGHYASPSRQWGLLNSKGDVLTPLGECLANAWGSRGKNMSFGELLDRWENNHSDLSNPGDLDAFAGYFLNDMASPDERCAWGEIIENTRQKIPVAAPLWEKRMESDLSELLEADDPKKYAAFFPALFERYANHPELCRRFGACDAFEQFAALVQGVFDWEYLRRLNEYRDLAKNNDFSEVEQCFLAETRSAAVRCSETMPSALRWALPTDIEKGNITSYAELANAVIGHHAKHQRRKDAAVFIDGDVVTVAGRIDAPNVCDFMFDLQSNPSSLLQKLRWRYRRNWYFTQNRQWLHYAGR